MEFYRGAAMLDDFSKHQQKIIKNYYRNLDQIQTQRLSELVTDLYLAEGKKKDKLWLSVSTTLEKLEIPKQRIDHLLTKKDLTLLAALVKELMS